MFKPTNKYQRIMIAVDINIGEDLPAPAMCLIRTFADDGDSFYVADGDRRIMFVTTGEKFPTLEAGRIFIDASVKLKRDNGKATGEDQRVFLRADVQNITSIKNKELPNLTLSELVAIAPNKRNRGGNRGGAGRPKKEVGKVKINKSISLSAAHWYAIDSTGSNYSKALRAIVEALPSFKK